MRSKFLPLFILPLLLLTTLAWPKVAKAECGGPVPPSPAGLRAVSGPQAGEVTLFWNGAPHANRYAVAYGESSGNYIYGADNIGGESSRSYTVKFLKPEIRYYFSLAAARDCSSSPFSNEVSAVAMGGTPITVGEETQAVPRVGQPAVEMKKPVSMPVSGSGKLNLQAMSGPSIGEVTLSWHHADSANDYHLVYGTSPGQHQYGALNIGRIQNFTVSYLNPGTTYYFALVPIFNNQALYTSAEATAKAKAMEVIVTTPENLGQSGEKGGETSQQQPSSQTGSPTKQPTSTPSGQDNGGSNILEKIEDAPADSSN